MTVHTLSGPPLPTSLPFLFSLSLYFPLRIFSLSPYFPPPPPPPYIRIFSLLSLSLSYLNTRHEQGHVVMLTRRDETVTINQEPSSTSSLLQRHLSLPIPPSPLTVLSSTPTHTDTHPHTHPLLGVSARALSMRERLLAHRRRGMQGEHQTHYFCSTSCARLGVGSVARRLSLGLDSR